MKSRLSRLLSLCVLPKISYETQNRAMNSLFLGASHGLPKAMNDTDFRAWMALPGNAVQGKEKIPRFNIFETPTPVTGIGRCA